MKARVVYCVPTAAPDRKGHRQRPANRTQLSGKRQLSRELVAVQLLGRDLPGRGQDAERNRQIEAARFLGQVGRRQVDGDAARRHVEADVLQGGADPVFCLAHLGIGEADDREPGETVGQVDFDADGGGFHAGEGAAS